LQWLSQWLSLRIVPGQQGRARNRFSFGGKGDKLRHFGEHFILKGFLARHPFQLANPPFQPAYLTRKYYGIVTTHRFASCPPSVTGFFKTGG
jgi:hypothetical protein